MVATAFKTSAAPLLRYVGIRVARRLRAGGLALFLSIAAWSAPSAAKQLDIVQIMEQFIYAGHAAGKCIKPDAQTLARYLFNFRMVSARASEAVKQRYPGRSDKQIADALKRRTDAVESAIDRIVRENGCGDPRVQDLLKRFQLQVDLDL